MTDKTDNQALEQANAQMASVREMVAALECDYDRLEELRDERNDLESEVNSASETFESASADEDYTREEVDEFEAELQEWIDENAEELAELEEQAGDCRDREDAEARIDQDALEVSVRSGWQTPNDEAEWSEFRIVLCTGGPHVEIRGELEQGEATRAWLEYSDWFTGMTERVNEDGDQDALLAYASRFFAG